MSNVMFLNHSDCSLGNCFTLLKYFEIAKNFKELTTEVQKALARHNLGIGDEWSLKWGNIKGFIEKLKDLTLYLNNYKSALDQKLYEHISDTNNPHNITKTQVGLSNVTNDALVKRSEMGVAGGVATLDGDGKVPALLLPSDEEDITVVDGKIKFKDRDTTNGMGYVILRKNKSFAEQVTKENTIYEIRYDFTLNEDITIPANCILKFNGGSLNGNTISSNGEGIIEGNIGISTTAFINFIFNKPNKTSKEITSDEIGLIPNDATKKGFNTSRLVKYINLGYSIVLTNKYYIESTDAITNSIFICGGQLIVDGEWELKSSINEISFRNVDIRYINDSFVYNSRNNFITVKAGSNITIGKLNIEGCHIQALRLYTHFCDDIDQQTIISSVKNVFIRNNNIVNTGIYCFIFTDCKVDNIVFENNFCYTFARAILNVTRTNEYKAAGEYTVANVVVSNNIFDSTEYVFAEDSIDNASYRYGVLAECEQLRVENNTFRNILSNKDNSISTGSVYSSCKMYSFIGNVVIDCYNLKFGLKQNHNICFKSKNGSGKIVNISNNIVRNTKEAAYKLGYTDATIPNIAPMSLFWLSSSGEEQKQMSIMNNTIEVLTFIYSSYNFHSYNSVKVANNIINSLYLSQGDSYLIHVGNDNRIKTIEFYNNIATIVNLPTISSVCTLVYGTAPVNLYYDNNKFDCITICTNYEYCTNVTPNVSNSNICIYSGFKTESNTMCGCLLKGIMDNCRISLQPTETTPSRYQFRVVSTGLECNNLKTTITSIPVHLTRVNSTGNLLVEVSKAGIIDRFILKSDSSILGNNRIYISDSVYIAISVLNANNFQLDLKGSASEDVILSVKEITDDMIKNYFPIINNVKQTLTADKIGTMAFDGTKPVWWTGDTTDGKSGWIDATGTDVPNPA